MARVRAWYAGVSIGTRQAATPSPSHSTRRSMPAGVCAAMNSSTARPDRGRVLVGHQPEGQLDEGVAGDDGLAAGALVAAADAVDLGRRAGAEPLQGG